MKIKNTIVKALSLGIGLATGIVLIAKVCYEVDYDRCYKDTERIYTIRTAITQQGKDTDYGGVSGAVAPGFRQYIPGVESATRTTFVWNSDRFFDENQNVIKGRCIVADSCFFDIFNTEILAGNPKEVLAEGAKAMISESFAKKLGGVSESIGKFISNEEMADYHITVGGVFKYFPYHSSVRYDVLLSLESLSSQSTQNWVGNDRYHGYVKLAENTDPDMLAPAIRDMQMKNQPLEEIRKSGTDIRYYLASLSAQHTSQPKIRNVIIILSITAILLTLISLLNYILISVSSMVSRSKEMGVRKCYGAERGIIYGIMAKEAAVDMIAAIAVAAAMILPIQNVLEDIIGVPLSALFIAPSYAMAAVVFVVVFIIAAIIPGYLYSRIPVSSAFRNYKENKKVWKLSLLFAQTFICSLLLSLMAVIAVQYNKAVNDKPGYEYENILWTDLTGTDKTLHQGIIDELLQVPGVTGVEMSYSLPLDYSSGNNVYMNEGANKGRELFNIADQYDGTAGLFELLEIPFVAGHYPQTGNQVAVSESFLKEMARFEDWRDGAVGKKICITEHSGSNQSEFTISGVYKDYRIHTLTNQDTRASIKFLGRTGSEYMPFMVIKVDNVSPEIIEKTRQVIQERIPDKEIEVKAYKDSMREAYSNEKRMKNTILAGCIISIIIALFGLMGYIRDESRRRSKEMAIRKINGAATYEIIRIYVIEILKIAAVAVVAGNIGAWFTAGIWLENFSEKVTLSPLFFIAADVVIIILVLSTIVASSLRISRSNPVESLRNE